MLRSCSNPPRNVNDVSSVFSRFLLDFGMRFFAWLARYLVKLEGDVVAPHIVDDVSNVRRFHHERSLVLQSSSTL